MKKSTIMSKLSGNIIATIMIVSFIMPSTIKAANVDYLIVHQSNLSESVISEFIYFKEQQGFKLQITSVYEITRSTTGSDDAEKIRNYLKNMQLKQGLKYVLLIGDPYDERNQDEQSTGGAIPMRYTFPLKGEKEFTNKIEDDLYRIPTDLYYADLTGNWDSDGDGYFGEFGEDKANLVPEIFIGRIPFSDKSTIESILNKSITFEMRSKKSKESAFLMATNNTMSKTYSDSATLMEVMWKDFLQKNNINRTTFYEKEGVHPSGFETDYSLNKANVLQQLQKQTVGLSVIVSNGGFMDDLMRRIWKKDSNYNDEPDEGEDEWISILDTNDASELSPENTSIFFLTGYMPNAIDWEEEDCIGKELLLTKAAAVLGESRLGYFMIDWEETYDGGMHSIVYNFCNTLTSGKSIGESLYKSFAYNTEHDWYNAFSHGSLYGDPSISLEEIKSVDINPPAAPKDLRVSKDGSQVVLTWTPSVKGTYSIEGYFVFRGTSSDVLSYVGNVGSSESTWTDHNIKSGIGYYYYVKAFDIKNNFSAESNTVSVMIEEEKKDVTPPIIKITSPKDGFITNIPNIDITGTVEDKESAVESLVINSQPVLISDSGAFDSKNNPLDEGLNEFIITASNSESISITEVLKVTLDTFPPILNLTTPFSPNTLQYQDKFLLLFEASDTGSDLASVLLTDMGGTSLPFKENGSSYQATLPLQKGNNLFTITAIDNAGNDTIQTIQLQYQPAVVITLVIGQSTAIVQKNLDRKEIPLQSPPVIKKGTTFVPIRFIAEAFGAKVGWIGHPTNEIQIEYKGTLIHLWIGKNFGVVEKGIETKKISLASPPYITKGTTMVPVRFIADGMGAETKWDGVKQEITIILAEE